MQPGRKTWKRRLDAESQAPVQPPTRGVAALTDFARYVLLQQAALSCARRDKEAIDGQGERLPVELH